LSAKPKTSTTEPKPPSTKRPEVNRPVKDYPNCVALNGDYPHGVGRPGARDETINGSQRVTNFKISKPLYEANSESDRDGDGIACEKL
jgi:Excalibur calcium-binding domain